MVGSPALTDPGANMLLGRTAANADDLTAMLNLLQASRRASLAPRIAASVPQAPARRDGSASARCTLTE